MSRATAMAAHPAGILTDAGIEARRRALALDLTLGDRAIAAVGGMIGGALTVAITLALDAHVRRLKAHPDR